MSNTDVTEGSTARESTLGPAPGAAPAPRMLAAQTGLELRLFLRNGEQLLLTLIIPVLLLVGFSTMPLLSYAGAERVAFITPGALALAIMSTAFTGQAIKTGFDRQYGVLKRLGATPLPRWGLLLAKTLSVLAIELLQLAVLAGVALVLGWRPDAGSVLEVAMLATLVALATAAFSGLALLMAGNLRAEVTLAGANLVYVVLLGLGGVLFPLAEFPRAIQPALSLLPMTALTDGLRQVLQPGVLLPGGDLLVIAAWTVLAVVAASATFKWE